MYIRDFSRTFSILGNAFHSQSRFSSIHCTITKGCFWTFLCVWPSKQGCASKLIIVWAFSRFFHPSCTFVSTGVCLYNYPPALDTLLLMYSLRKLIKRHVFHYCCSMFWSEAKANIEIESQHSLSQPWKSEEKKRLIDTNAHQRHYYWISHVWRI